MAALLQIDPDAILGKLARFWIWADQQSIDGKDLNVTDSVIDRVTHQPGFSAALREVAWLSARSGSLTIPHFDRHNGQSAKDRALAAKRKKSQRERDKCHDPGVTKSGPEKDSSLLSVSSLSPPKSEEKEELRTVIPLLLSTDEFAAAWRDWLQHRREIRKPVKPGSQAEKGQLKMLEGWGVERAIPAIRHTIAMGWTGLREAEAGANSHGAGNGLPAVKHRAAWI